MITVIGSINLDLTGTVGRLPGPGETVPGDAFATAPGGKGANQALAARRAGAEVQMIGAVGDDAFAEEALALLREDSVQLAAVRQSRAATGIALILVSSDGENMIAVIAGANDTVLPGDVEAVVIDPGDVVLLQQEIPLETVEAALNAAREAGAMSILNTAPWRDDWARLIPLADIIVANETEFDLAAAALGLAGSTCEEKAAAFVAKTGRTIVVTLGGDGAVAAAPDGTARAEAPKITPVDTVGAGDTFCGYLAAGLAEGMDITAAMARAAKAGAAACLKPGAQPAIPRLDEL
ncbi:MAG: ribokinase [Rhizobiaceae bacterium]